MGPRYRRRKEHDNYTLGGDLFILSDTDFFFNRYRRKTEKLSRVREENIGASGMPKERGPW